jgi:hypothetical protein
VKIILRHFWPTVQVEYILLQQLDTLANTKWNSLLATKPEVPDVNVAHDFFAGTSNLARKWKDKVEQYNIF